MQKSHLNQDSAPQTSFYFRNASKAFRSSFAKFPCYTPYLIRSRCMTLYENVAFDFKKYKKFNRRFLSSQLAQNKGGKANLISWNGKDLVEMFSMREPNVGALLTERSAARNMLSLELVKDLLHKARLPPFEFIMSFHQKMGPESRWGGYFGVAKTLDSPGILVPNVFGPELVREVNGSYTWGHDFPPSIPWSDKQDVVFYRGSLVGVEEVDEQHLFAGFKTDILCLGHRKKIRSRITSRVDTGVICRSGNTSFAPVPPIRTAFHKKVCGECPGNYVPYESAFQHKYLAVPMGSGYTGRFKDFLASGSVNFKYFPYKVYEHFEVSMVHGSDGHYFELSGGTLDSFIEAVNWAHGNDTAARRMTERAEAHMKWALSDKTVLCYMWKLMERYVKHIDYDVIKQPIMKDWTNGTRGMPLAMGLKRGSPISRHYEAFVASPTEDSHSRFVNECEHLPYPSEARPGS